MGTPIDIISRTAIYDAAVSASNLTVIWDKPGQIRPAIPYVTINLLLPSPITKKDSIRKEEDIYTNYHRKDIALIINVYSQENSYTLIENIINRFNMPTTQTILRKGKIAFLRSKILDGEDNLLETKFERRSTAIIFLSYASSLDEDITEVHKVTYEDICGNEQTVEVT